jgi:histidinol-phosphate aminotransferase
VLEKVRPPYNVSALDQRAATYLVREAAGWCAARAADVVAERDRLAIELAAFGDVFDSAANLLLVRFAKPDVWQRLADRGIATRSFGAGPLAGCLRITIGTPAENAALLEALGEL